MTTYPGDDYPGDDYPGDDEGLEGTEVPTTPRSAVYPDEGPGPEADAPDGGADAGADDIGPANSDAGD